MYFLKSCTRLHRVGHRSTSVITHCWVSLQRCNSCSSATVWPPLASRLRVKYTSSCCKVKQTSLFLFLYTMLCICTLLIMGVFSPHGRYWRDSSHSWLETRLHPMCSCWASSLSAAVHYQYRDSTKHNTDYYSKCSMLWSVCSFKWTMSSQCKVPTVPLSAPILYKNSCTMGCITNIMYWHYGLDILNTYSIREWNYNQLNFTHHSILNVLHYKMSI